MQSFLPHGVAATRRHELISSGQWWLSKSAALRHATAMVVLWSFVTATRRAERGSGKTPAKTRTLFTWLQAPASGNGIASTTAASLWLDYKGGAPEHSDVFTDELGAAGEWSPASGASSLSLFFLSLLFSSSSFSFSCSNTRPPIHFHEFDALISQMALSSPQFVAVAVFTSSINIRGIFLIMINFGLILTLTLLTL